MSRVLLVCSNNVVSGACFVQHIICTSATSVVLVRLCVPKCCVNNFTYTRRSSRRPSWSCMRVAFPGAVTRSRVRVVCTRARRIVRVRADRQPTTTPNTRRAVELCAATLFELVRAHLSSDVDLHIDVFCPAEQCDLIRAPMGILNDDGSLKYNSAVLVLF